MKENAEVKSLIKVNEKSLFYRIKNFFKNLLKREPKESLLQTENTVAVSEKDNEKRNAFMESITNIENEETKLLKLQKQYRNGEIKEEQLTQEQINSLSALYDKQIANLRKSNQIRKQKLLEYRKRLQTDN